jgi:integrase
LTTAARYVHWLDGKQLLSPGITADAIEGKLRGVLGKKKRTLERRHREADDTVGVPLGYYATQLASTPVSPKHPRKRLTLLRDHAILQVLYATAGRASEVAQLARRDIQEGKKVTSVEITGKGNKRRPLLLTTRRWRPSGLTWKPAGPTNMTACSSRAARMPATR